MTGVLSFKCEGIIKTPRDVYEDFEGPLDLILHLLSRDKIAISDLKISVLLEQYLSWMEEMKRMDLEVASEFTVMASHLVYLKSRMLLTAGNAPDEAAELIGALEERRRQEEMAKLSGAIEFLAAQAHLGRDYFSTPPKQLEASKLYARIHSPYDLIRAYDRLFIRKEQLRPPEVAAFSGIVATEPYPVSRKIRHILDSLLKTGKRQLSALLSAAKERSEKIAAFLAILELCRDKKITITDGDGDYDIALYKAGDK